MKLYHGTSERRLPFILQGGLKPRAMRAGNWSHTVNSNSRAVYLTAGYAPYFAYSAVDAKTKERGAIIELDTDRLNSAALAPDEDFLAQIDQRAGRIPDLMERTKFYRKTLRHRAGDGSWALSVDSLGTCCHFGTIPASAFTRVALIEWERAPATWMQSIDPAISVSNWRIVGRDKYPRLTRFILGDEEFEGTRYELSDGQIIQWDATPPVSEREAIEVRQL